ncbi:MAG: hypothetical protein HZA24_04570 [Nitrospirae bacterium]|nr:hypothetical protein [Nitrospirota bacterium]
MIVRLLIRDIGEPVSHTLPDGVTTQAGDTVLVEVDGMITYATTAGPSFNPPEVMSCCQRPRGPALRVATPEDMDRVAFLRQRERDARVFCQERADAMGLDMRVTDMEGNLSGNNLTCYFVADQRVDFRQLVRDMGGRFHCHVLMRQVPAREQARRVCGIGPCGRTLCCSSFMGKPRGVTSQEARKSAPGVAHSKLTGTCGKLMCCLAFESGDEEADRQPALVQIP